MAGKVLSIGRKIQPQQPIQPQTQPESWGGYASRNLRTGLVNLVKNLEAPGASIMHQTPEMIESLKERGIPNYIQPQHQATLSNIVQSGLGVTPEQLQQKPANLAETFIQKFIPTAGAALLGSGIPGIGVKGGGGSIIQNLQSAAASSAAGTGAKALGLGPKGEAISEMIGGTGWNLWKMGGTPGYLRKQLRPEMEKALNTAKKEGSKIRAKVPEYEKYLKDEIETLTSGNPGIPKAEAKAVAKELQGRLNQIQLGEITPTKLMEQKAHFYKLYDDYKGSPNKIEKAIGKFYYRAGGAGTGELNKLADKYPSFGNDYKFGTDLYKGLDAQGAIRKMFEKNTDIKHIASKLQNPLKVALLGGSGLYFGKPAALVGAAAIPTALAGRYATRAYDLFAKSTIARSLADRLAVAAIKGNKGAFVNALNALDNETKKQDRSEKKIGKVLRIA
jgi:hypothetical protein